MSGCIKPPASGENNRAFVKPAQMANSNVCNFDLKKEKLTDELQRKKTRLSFQRPEAVSGKKQAPNVLICLFGKI